jgi:hypothetical protein
LRRGGAINGADRLEGASGRGWQNSLGLDPSLKFFVQTLDCICGAYTAPLARRQASEGEQAFSSLFQAVGDSTVLSLHLRMKALRRTSISSGVVA